ncbi:lysophosphatidic acid receptor 6 [Hydra vulgaris]|uniref:lysophosphatidic acid receptor 6 n=1 Tax=Hydra vulgaris TaxID=6087 RepID=UPI001F5E5CDC|nr:lysophosphatidic acid receptor 6-like [Hydra vulgaris]
MITNFTEVSTSRPSTIENITSQQLLITAFTLILITGVVGNAFVIYTFGVKIKSNHRSTTELLTLYLGIIDLLSSFLNPSFFIYITIIGYRRWHFGKIGCQIIPSLGPIMTSISSGLLLIFAIDRYLAVVTPFRQKLTHKKVTIAFIIDIFLSIIVYSHYAFALNFDPKSNICIFPDASVYSFGIPNCVIIILRLSIFATVFSFTNIKIFQVLKKCNVNLTRKENQEERFQKLKKIMIILLTMGVVFILLVFPRELFYLYYNILCFKTKNCKESSDTLREINSWLKVAHTANSCANVFIYSHMLTVYRKQVFRTFSNLRKLKKVFSRKTFSAFPKSFINKRRRYLPCNYKQQYTKVLLIPDEDFKDSSEVIFFQRAQQWKFKKIIV